MSCSTLIAKQQAAKTITRSFDKGRFPKTLAIDGAMAGDTIPLYHIGIDGATTTALYDSGSALTFSATRTTIIIDYPCIISIIKGVTANAVGLQLVEIG